MTDVVTTTILKRNGVSHSEGHLSLHCGCVSGKKAKQEIKKDK